MDVIDKKGYIEKIAFRLFLTAGYEATSIRRICKEAKIDPPTLYNFFGSKKGLFLSIAENLLGEFMHESKSYNNLLRSLPPEVQLYSIFITSINFCTEHLEETRFFFRYSLFCPDELQEDVQEFLRNSYAAKYKTVNAILNECMQVNLIGIDVEKASLYFRRFVNTNSFSVVFENWRPSKEELLETWDDFYKCRLKGLESKK